MILKCWMAFRRVRRLSMNGFAAEAAITFIHSKLPSFPIILSHCLSIIVRHYLSLRLTKHAMH